MKYVKGSAKLIEKNSLSEKVYEVKFWMNEDFEFVPGEFLNLNVGDDNWRSYSILDYQDKIATFIIDITPSGPGSKFTQQINVNDETRFIGPFGKFLLTDSERSIFVCTGTGLAPVIPMVKMLLNKGENEIRLLYGVRYDNEDLLDRYFSREELDQMKVVRCITRSEKTQGVYKGRVTQYLEEEIKDLSSYASYVCGNPSMVTEVIPILKRKDCKTVISEKY